MYYGIIIFLIEQGNTGYRYMCQIELNLKYCGTQFDEKYSNRILYKLHASNTWWHGLYCIIGRHFSAPSYKYKTREICA